MTANNHDIDNGPIIVQPINTITKTVPLRLLLMRLDLGSMYFQNVILTIPNDIICKSVKHLLKEQLNPHNLIEAE